VPPIRHSSVVTADVKAVLVAPAQPEDDTMSREVRAKSWTIELRMARVESWAL
jgi:hypothetical protein